MKQFDPQAGDWRLESIDPTHPPIGLSRGWLETQRVLMAYLGSGIEQPRELSRGGAEITEGGRIEAREGLDTDA